MNFQKYMVLIVGCGIAGLLTIGAGVVLFQKMAAHGKAEAELRSARQKYATLEKRAVHPNDANLAATSSNLVQATAAFSNVIQKLRAGQLQELTNTVEFAPMVEEVVKRLQDGAKSAGVMLPQDFAFGFDTYKKGTRPAAEAVPRLALQLRTTELVCKILYAARISNVVAISREEFDDGASQATPSSAGGASLFSVGRSESRPSASGAVVVRDIPMSASNQIYSTERFYVEFTGRENAAWEVLNALAKGPPFAVIRHADIEATLPAFGGTAGRGSPVTGSATSQAYGEAYGRGFPAGGAATLLSTNSLVFVEREDRVLAGRETVKAAIVFDVVRFAESSGGAP